ncbi:MAG: hypothetical protein WC069_02230 [Candidatus Shapirobacteria bacterium]
MIRKIYLSDHNQVLADIEDSFEIVDDWMDADAVVVWQDVRGELVNIVAQSNLMGIPTFVMQHGLRASREYLPEYGKELLSQRIMVWGPQDKVRMIKSGVEPERIVVTGTTILDHLKPKQKHAGINVLFVPLHWDKEIEENYEVANILNQIKDIRVLTKLVDGQRIENYKNVILSNRDDKNHLDKITNILKDIDVLVSLSESTMEFMAYYLDIPVVVVNNWRPKKFLDYEVLNINKDISNACEVTDINSLEKVLKNVIENPGKKSKERILALKLEMGVGFDNKTAKQRIVETIKSVDQDLD